MESSSDHSHGESEEEYFSEDSNANVLSASGESEEESFSSAESEVPSASDKDDSEDGESEDIEPRHKLKKITETVEVTEPVSRGEALYQSIARDKPRMKRALAKYTDVNRVPAVEYYQQRRKDNIPRPASQFQSRKRSADA